MLGKAVSKKLSVVQKTNILLSILANATVDSTDIANLSAPQMQDLRNFLEQQIRHFSALQDEKALTPEDIKNQLEPIPNYYHKQDCREPLEACYNETCLVSESTCFSKKMRSQIRVLVEILNKYILPEQTESKV